jgi:uncharacterized protein YraI
MMMKRSLKGGMLAVLALICISMMVGAGQVAAQTAAYSANPPEGSILDFGLVGIGATANFVITVTETGNAALSLSAPSTGIITGEHANDFVFVAPALPVIIADGGSAIVITIQCKPTTFGVRNAVLSLVTNDVSRPTVTYSLRCTAAESVATPFATPFATGTPLPATLANVFFVKGLAVRTGPYLGASIVAIARQGTQYGVYGKNDDEGVYTWYLIDVNGERGWASGRYLNISGDLNIPSLPSIFDQIDNAQDNLVRGMTISDINLRRRPSSRVDPLLIIPWGAEVKILGFTESGSVIQWLHVEYNGVRGWAVPNWIRITSEPALRHVPQR